MVVKFDASAKALHDAETYRQVRAGSLPSFLDREERLKETPHEARWYGWAIVAHTKHGRIIRLLRREPDCRSRRLRASTMPSARFLSSVRFVEILSMASVGCGVDGQRLRVAHNPTASAAAPRLSKKQKEEAERAARPRRTWIAARQERGDTGTICRRFGVSRSVLRKWLRRYDAEGDAGLAERSRRPRQSPAQKVGESEAELIVRLRRERHLCVKRLRIELAREALAGCLLAEAENIGVTVAIAGSDPMSVPTIPLVLPPALHMAVPKDAPALGADTDLETARNGGRTSFALPEFT